MTGRGLGDVTMADLEVVRERLRELVEEAGKGMGLLG